MTTKELYTKGARVWIHHPETVWIGAELLEDYKTNQLKVLSEDGEVTVLKIKSDTDLPPLRNPDILIGENDLTSLSYLHEPAVLYNLKVRFCNQNAIYTYCGIVLVAINPYEELPIYGSDTVWAYRGQAMGDLDPHIFAVAEEAYTKLEREDQDQSIIVSGESGAGKTVSAKYAMRYFATVGGSSTETQIEKKVLASSPIMEAIGNAKTTRNDNSSRFGKFIEIDFNKHYHIIGASMRTYLLEKSRVVFQAPEERNYHIFYQLCSSRNLPELKELHLRSQEEFRYTNQGESPTIDGIDDQRAFEETRNALTLLGFSEREQINMFRILASVLHLGNVDILEAIPQDGKANEEEGSIIKPNDRHLHVLSKLLEIDQHEMSKWLCHRKIVSMREVFTKPMTASEAMFSRDALAKHIYAELFNWIVLVVNKSLQTSSKTHKFIGVLDIYGFETFEINSFEQFCINYANEKLQQQFNQHVFKLEQEEYLREEIEWKFIDFYDNQPCIDLIESKLGILDLLDEECRMPKGTDQSWVEKLYDKCKRSKHFVKPRFGNSAFVIHHFADNVQYESEGFLEKNRDTVIEEQIQVLRNSQNKLITHLFAEVNDGRKLSVPSVKVRSAAAKAPTASKQHKKTVGSQFRDSLNMLMGTLNQTTPHYVRCIKPNDEKQQFIYNPERAVQQLRACGVLETIRISAAGYPSRWTYMDFFQRYRVLCRSKDISRHNMRRTCEKILNNFIKEEDKFQFGKAKIFFRAGQVAYLEKLRADRLRNCCIMVQKHVRGFIARCRYRKIRRSALCIQKYGRGLLGRRRANHFRRTRAATTIQRYVRGWVKKTQYLRTKRCMVGLQAYARGKFARQRYQDMRRNAKAIFIQKHVRGWLARLAYKRSIRNLILVQCTARRWFARRELRKLKLEARSVEHIKKLNKGLENKIISLQQKIEELMKENNNLKTANNEINELRRQVDALKTFEKEYRTSVTHIGTLEEELETLKRKLQEERDEKMDLVNEKEKLEKEKLSEMEQMNAHNLSLKGEIEKLNDLIQAREKGAQEDMKTKIEQEKALLIQEHDQDRNAYQKLLKEYNKMELQKESLETRLRHVSVNKKSHERSFSNASTLSAQDAQEDAMSATSEIPDEDFGYGSVRSTASASSTNTHIRVDTIEWLQETKSGSASPEGKQVTNQIDVDVGLVLKLQQKVKELEKDKSRLEKRVEELEKEDSPTDGITRAQDSIRLQELEMENAKLKDNISQLRESIAVSTSESSKELMTQFDALQEELSRRREECIQLRSILANKTENLKSIARSNYGHDVDIINEDGELVEVCNTLKETIRQLEDEHQQDKKKFKNMEEEYKLEIERLKEDNDRQQKLLSQNLTKSPQSQTEAFMQHEITRLTAENLDLQEKYDAVSEQAKKLKRQVKLYAKKLKEMGGIETTPEPVEAVSREQQSNLPAVRKKERDYMGMFAYRKEDEPLIIKHLIFELKPKIAVQMLPGLPAYILFMCIRHTDFVNDDEKVRSLLTSTINGIKRVIKKRHEDLETTVLWLANTLRLLHNLKQYGGDKTFQAENTPKQNEQCLRNFDLSEYRQVLSDIAVWIYQGVIRLLEEKVQQMIVPAILEHEAISGLSGMKPGGMRGRAASVTRELESPVSAQKAMQQLLAELNNFYTVLGYHGVDPELVFQVFRQLFYFICAASLNNLLLRKDLCHWSKGMQIRYNLSHMEQWIRDHKMQDKNVLSTLDPVVQAAQLLQARKNDEDVQSVCDMCDKLSAFQIIKILNLYTPADDFEERVPVSFIRKIQAKLQERTELQSQSTLLMDSKFTFPVRFPFNPSKIRLEDIEIPDVLNLPMLSKV